MQKEINFKNDHIKQLLHKKEWDKISIYLEKTFKAETTDSGELKKFAFNNEVLDALFNILKTVLQNELHTKNNVLFEVLRALRNCATNELAQNYLTQTDFTEIFKQLFVVLSIEKGRELKVFLQLLINLMVSNAAASKKIYSHFFTEIFNCFQNTVYLNETSALLYYLSLHNCVNDLETVKSVFSCYSMDKTGEYLQFFLEKLPEQENFWLIYDLLEPQHKICALELILQLHIDGTTQTIPNNGLELLVNKFLDSSEIIFQTSNLENNLLPHESALILQIISSISSHDVYLKYLQSNKDILINAGVLLINIHRLGKSSENCFSSIQKLSDVGSEVTEHPAFGFKGDLVRLIGNLCWKNKIMQDLARQAEVIPVLLDCCNIDARNPFILQWVILALRNLCEGNLENQKIIAGLHREGTVSSSALQEVGITLHSEGDNEIKIVGLDSLKK